MSKARTTRGSFIAEMVVASLTYVAASVVTFKAMAPVQNLFFPQFPSHASLLFLPHGVRVLAGWLLGWRATPALLPGVFIVFAMIAGTDVFLPSRLAAILIAVTVSPAMFWASARLGWNVFPGNGRTPCWSCVMVIGILISIVNAALTNLVLDTGAEDYFAFLIGDVFGLFFLMLILMLVFRGIRKHENAIRD